LKIRYLNTSELKISKRSRCNSLWFKTRKCNAKE